MGVFRVKAHAQAHYFQASKKSLTLYLKIISEKVEYIPHIKHLQDFIKQ